MDALDSIKIDSALAAQAEREAAEDEVGQTDFLTMLVAQLENQDPLNPQDSAAFAAQLAQFSSVEQLVAMRAGIDSLVAAGASGASAGSTGASALDPTNLVGKWVTVFGSQIEVDDAGSPIEVDFRSIETAADAEVVITDAAGNVVHQASILPRNEDGTRRSLQAGDHVFRFDPSTYGLPSGNYGIEFRATGSGGEPITLLPMVEGLVSGAILAGEPGIRIGNRVFSVDDVLEVRIPGDETGAASTVVAPGRQAVAPRPAPGPVSAGSV